jgi:hypothetical protein
MPRIYRTRRRARIDGTPEAFQPNGCTWCGTRLRRSTWREQGCCGMPMSSSIRIKFEESCQRVGIGGRIRSRFSVLHSQRLYGSCLKHKDIASYLKWALCSTIARDFGKFGESLVESLCSRFVLGNLICRECCRVLPEGSEVWGQHGPDASWPEI